MVVTVVYEELGGRKVRCCYPADLLGITTLQEARELAETLVCVHNRKPYPRERLRMVSEVKLEKVTESVKEVR